MVMKRGDWPGVFETYETFHRLERLMKYGLFDGSVGERIDPWDEEFKDWDDEYCRLKGWKE